MATATYFLSAQGETSKQAIAEVKKSVQEFVSSTHPAALIAWGIVGIVILAGLVFIGWHTINLFALGHLRNRLGSLCMQQECATASELEAVLIAWAEQQRESKRG